MAAQYWIIVKNRPLCFVFILEKNYCFSLYVYHFAIYFPLCLIIHCFSSFCLCLLNSLHVLFPMCLFCVIVIKIKHASSHQEMWEVMGRNYTNVTKMCSFIKQLLLNLPYSSRFDKWNQPVFLWVHLCRGMKLKLKDEQFHGSLVFDVNTAMSSPLFSVENYLSLLKIYYQKEKLPSHIFRAWHSPRAEGDPLVNSEEFKFTSASDTSIGQPFDIPWRINGQNII